MAASPPPTGIGDPALCGSHQLQQQQSYIEPRLSNYIVSLQVCHRIEEDDAVGWVPAQVKMMKGEFVVIDYVHPTHSVTDIVNVDLVRLPSKK